MLCWIYSIWVHSIYLFEYVSYNLNLGHPFIITNDILFMYLVNKILITHHMWPSEFKNCSTNFIAWRAADSNSDVCLFVFYSISMFTYFLKSVTFTCGLLMVVVTFNIWYVIFQYKSTPLLLLNSIQLYLTLFINSENCIRYWWGSEFA